MLRMTVWAPPVPLAATPGITFVFSSSGYLDVSVHRVPLRDLLEHTCSYSVTDTRSLSVWVSPFRDPWITGYLLLPTAFRSLSRLSSALSARASTLRSFLLNLFLGSLAPPPHSVAAREPAFFVFTEPATQWPAHVDRSAVYSFFCYLFYLSLWLLPMGSAPTGSSDVFIVFWIFSIRFSRYVLHKSEERARKALLSGVRSFRLVWRVCM